MAGRDHRWFVACLVGVAVAVALMAPATAQPGRRTTYEQITVSTSAVAIGTSTLTSMSGCQLRVETDSVRYRTDGTAPTSSVGMPVSAGDVIYIDHREDATNARFIRSGSVDATLNVQCWP